MKLAKSLFISGFLFLAVASFGATRYVNLGNLAPAAPYTSWATAATNIQEAVDAAGPGDEIVVADGTYANGGRAVYGTMTNRVVIDKAVTVRSVNGPSFTTIEGWQVPFTTNGDGAIRCAYVGTNAVLSGFTLTNGATRLLGDNAQEKSGGGVYCASADATVTNCVLSGNSACYYGGGAFRGTLNNCVLVGNAAVLAGGGANSHRLNNCVLVNNSTFNIGGGAFGGTLNNCMLSGNSARVRAGGAYDATLNNCIVYYNKALQDANWFRSTLNYCCTTPLPAGGIGNLTAEPQMASASHLDSGSPCRRAGSAAYASGVDIDGEAWLNPPSIGCDEYHSGSVTGALSVVILASCTNVGAGFEVEFQGLIGGEVSASRWEFGGGVVVSNRPYASHAFVEAGDYAVVLRAYNDGNPLGVTSTAMVHVVERPIHYVSLSSVSPTAPFSSWETAATDIQDAVDSATVPGALVLVSNGVYQTGGHVVYGLLTNRLVVTNGITVQSVNGPDVTAIAGCHVPGTTNGDGAVRCAYLSNGAVLSGFTLTNGATRTSGSTTQEQSAGGVLCDSVNVMVTNCVLVNNSASWNGGGACYGVFNNCMLIGNSGVFDGGGAYYSVLHNCVLSSNSVVFHGGAGCYGVFNNCMLIGNSAAFDGGGAYYSILNNCTLSGNAASSSGGGACISTLNNCTLVGNTASSGGGGAKEGTLNNCILYNNSASNGSNYYGGVFRNCCTIPMPAGSGNITNAPLFVDLAGGDLRLRENSPCINAGNNAYAASLADLDGNPRIAGGTVDMGAYEFQSPASEISYAWLQQYGLSADGLADSADLDNDGFNNWQEWTAGTDPTNSASALRMLMLLPGTNTLNTITISWSTVTNRTYALERASVLGIPQAFELVRTNIPGLTDTTSFTDTNATGSGPFFYRVRLEN